MATCIFTYRRSVNDPTYFLCLNPASFFHCSRSNIKHARKKSSDKRKVFNQLHSKFSFGKGGKTSIIMFIMNDKRNDLHKTISYFQRNPG